MSGAIPMSNSQEQPAEPVNQQLLPVLRRVAGILRGAEDEDQGAAYDRAQRVVDAAIAAATAQTKGSDQ